jgi:hypothetical protein
MSTVIVIPYTISNHASIVLAIAAGRQAHDKTSSAASCHRPNGIPRADSEAAALK